MFIKSFISLTLLFTFLTLKANSLPQGFTLLDKEKTPYTIEVKPETEKVLFYYWAQWCATCRPKLQKTLPKMVNEYPKVLFIAVNIDSDEFLGKAISYVNLYKISLPIVRDPSLRVKSAPHYALYQKKNDQWELIEEKDAFDDEHIKALLGSNG